MVVKVWHLVLTSCLYLTADADNHAQLCCSFLGVHEVKCHALHVSCGISPLSARTWQAYLTDNFVK